jgi:ribonuclease HI
MGHQWKERFAWWQVLSTSSVLPGLQAAQDNRWAPLEVVGDSQFILQQLRLYKPPNNKILLELYATARRLADSLGVREWHHPRVSSGCISSNSIYLIIIYHHLRAHNKMADAAANAAMDSRSSSHVHHPTTRTSHAALAQHLGNDFAHWQANYFARMKI